MLGGGSIRPLSSIGPRQEPGGHSAREWGREGKGNHQGRMNTSEKKREESGRTWGHVEVEKLP